jgi:hypothetical protein
METIKNASANSTQLYVYLSLESIAGLINAKSSKTSIMILSIRGNAFIKQQKCK